MIYRQRYRVPHRYLAASLTLLMGLLAIGTLVLFQKTITQLGMFLLSPAIRAIKNVSTDISIGMGFLEPKANIVADNQLLEKELSLMQSRTADYDSLVEENQHLMSMLKMESPNLVPASILISSPATPYDTIIIDRGLESGLKVGSRVYLSERMAIGEIEEVSNKFSKVRLFSSPGIKTESFIGRTGELVSIIGRGGSNFLIEAPKGFDVKEGDMVFLPGSSRYAVASVRKIVENENSSFVQVMMSVPLPLRGNSILLVERP